MTSRVAGADDGLGGEVRWFDNHCHLTSLATDPAEAVALAQAAGVGRLLTVGCSVADSRRAIEIANEFDNVWATAGVHPHDSSDGIEGLAELLSAPKVVAVGECGFDFHYNYSDPHLQRAAFVAQIRLAHEHDLALVIHTREAWQDTFDVLDVEGIPDRTVFHCFTGGPAEADACLARGAYLSFSGIVTFKTAQDLRDAAALTPLDRILIETDSPYLAPVPYRGKPNQPAFVAEIGNFLAAEKACSVAEFAALTWENTNRLFSL
ncbi:MAG: TatD family hydrolase [Acidimicrobiales bacterium]